MGVVGERYRWGDGRSPGLGGYAIHMWRLNEPGASKTSGEEQEPEEWWSRVCVSGLLRVYNWEDEILLNREIPALSKEMWES